MAKKKKRTRFFKVRTDFNGIPFVRFGGKYLYHELGLTNGDRLEMIKEDDKIIFRKMTDTEASFKDISRCQTAYKRLFNLCEKHLEAYVCYQNVEPYKHTLFLNDLKQCGKVATILSTLTRNETHQSKAIELINEYKRQLAWCEQSFYEEKEIILLDNNFPHLELYEHLLTLLRDCAQHLGIFTRRNLFSFKNKRHLFQMGDHKSYYPHAFNPMMVAENRDLAYNIDDEIANNPEKYSQA